MSEGRGGELLRVLASRSKRWALRDDQRSLIQDGGRGRKEKRGGQNQAQKLCVRYRGHLACSDEGKVGAGVRGRRDRRHQCGE